MGLCGPVRHPVARNFQCHALAAAGWGAPAPLWFFGSKAGSEFPKPESAGNLKATWVNHEKARDGFNSRQGQGEEFLRHASPPIQNTWVPYREWGSRFTVHGSRFTVHGSRFTVRGSGRTGHHRPSPACVGSVGPPGGGSRMRNGGLFKGNPYPGNTSLMYPLKMDSWATIFPDGSPEDRTPGQTNAGLVQKT
jgi:hypothetical protein